MTEVQATNSSTKILIRTFTFYIMIHKNMDTAL